MKKIKLTQNQFAIIDDQDFEKVNQLKWHYHQQSKGKSSTGYASSDSLGKSVKMHRFILGIIDSSIEVDHKNGDGLDNQRLNLRVCTSQQNKWNQGLNRRNTSGYKGVSWRKDMKKWAAGYRLNNKSIHVGFFISKKEAARAYNSAVMKVYGEFARLNILIQK